MLLLVKGIVLVLATVGLAYLSRKPLASLSAHGFYRFFAWEAIVLLVLLNLDVWFSDPLAPHQLASWLCLVISGVLVVHGVYVLRVLGRPDQKRDDPGLIGIEKTTRLITSGAYRYIRHPLYSSLLFLAWGAFFKLPSWVGLALVVAATVLLTMTAKVEEVENLRYFGPAYADYMKHTTRFIPWVF